MRIAVDARELAGSPTGVGRYLREILSAWGRLPGASSHEFIFCAPAGAEVAPPAGLRGSVRRAAGRGTAWEQLALGGLATTSGADVLFAPGYSGPVRRTVPMVVTVHDVSFAAHPEWFSRREGLRRRLLTRWSAAKASRVITVSDFSKREIVRRLGVDPAKVEVIYSGAPAGGAPAPHTPRPGGTVLYVGSIFNRRHVPSLIDGFCRLAARHAGTRLEIIGDNRSRPHLDLAALARRCPASDRISIRSYVPDTEVAAAYARASAFAFLSEYEGFGLPPLEALAAGVPIVVLDTEVAREIYGPAAIYVERPDPPLIERALERALYDDIDRARVLESASAQLRRYSWDGCARRTLQVLLACGGG
jgi:glycosyltransferase involved in cell wall biosynthesis